MNFGHCISSLAQSPYCRLAQRSIAEAQSRDVRYWPKGDIQTFPVSK